MRVTATDKDRTAIPRWRPIKRVPKQDLASIKKQDGDGGDVFQAERQRAELWRTDNSLESAVDLLDLGIASGNTRWAIEGAAAVLTHKDNARPELIIAAENTLARRSPEHGTRYIFGDETIEFHLLTEKIRILKKRAIEFPRDSLIHCELARNYAILGQADRAERHIFQSLFLAPNNRYILRAATKFFNFWDAPEEAISFLRKAEGFQYDPWIQSAELASCQTAEKATQIPKQTLRSLRSDKAIERNRSELATGFALLEFESGLKNRAVNSILRAALHDPTENAIAQALWVGEHSSADLQVLAHRNLQDPQAWEARSRAHFLERRFEESEQQAVLWFYDQQLEVRAALAAAYLNLIHLNNAKRAVSISERALKIHPRDWSLRNCAALSAAYSGATDQAKDHIKAMSLYGDDPEKNIFVAAAEGFLAFCEGDAPQGRKFYEEAILRAKKLSRPSLVLNAAIFWLERESTIHGISGSEADQVLNCIETAFKKLAVHERSDARATFESRKIVIKENLKGSSSESKDGLISAARFNDSIEFV